MDACAAELSHRHFFGGSGSRSFSRLILRHTRFGNAVFATGGNAQAARLQGIRIDRIRILNFVISGLLAALAGIVRWRASKASIPCAAPG